MNSESKELSMNDFIDDIDKSFKPVKTGDILKGKIISKHDDGIIVNINYMYDGLIPRNEIAIDNDVKIHEEFIIGEDIDVYVLKNNDGEGHVLLSKKIADSIVIWDELQEIYKTSSILNVKVSEVVKGGVIGYFKGVRTFIPASQLSLNFVKNLNDFIGQNLEVKIIELDKEKKKVVVSRRIIEEENRKVNEEKLWNSLKIGELRRGKVVRLMSFGAFVDLGGLQGLIHLRDLSWRRVLKPEEVVSIGEEVEVYVLSLDKENKKLGLSLKATVEDPWNSVNESLKVGNIIEGTVKKLVNFGAFVELIPGIEGLVHLNEISEENILKPEDKLHLGDKAKVKILEINKDSKRISLSIKDAIEGNKDFEKYNESNEVTLGDLFSDKLKGFKFD